jgi:hypothetical protein
MIKHGAYHELPRVSPTQNIGIRRGNVQIKNHLPIEITTLLQLLRKVTATALFFLTIKMGLSTTITPIHRP